MGESQPKPEPGDKWYFAYGSNLSVDQQQQRTGAIRCARRCRLRDYRLVFNKRGKTGQLYANIDPARGREVWGVVYLCSPDALRKMDIREAHYCHLAVDVVTDNGETLRALTYVADPESVSPEGSPGEVYLNTILSGARHHRLPEDYIRELETVAAGGAAQHRPTGSA